MAGHVMIDGPSLQKLLRAPYGIVGRDLLRRADKVVWAAKGFAPKMSGNLRDSIHADKRPFDTGTGLGVYIRASTPYALAVHEGRRALTIVPKTKTILRFQVGGQIVWAKEVHQPARRGNPFLRTALKAAG